MKKIENKRLNECYYKEVLDSGLEVVIKYKPGFFKSNINLAVKFGSFDYTIEKNAKTKNIKEGLAHFLEHQMFSKPDNRDASLDFEELGLKVNAYTTYDRTVYYFYGTENILEGIDKLFDLISTPFFDEVAIDLEKSIIEQELVDSLDYPEFIAYNQLLKNMYLNCRINKDIGGSVESVNEINKDDLEEAYNYFYQPNNMKLVIVSGINPEQLIEKVKENESKLRIYANKIERFSNDEPYTVVKKYEKLVLNVSKPKVFFGLKLKPIVEIDEMLKMFFGLNMMLDAYFDDTSSFYNRMLEEQVVDNSFDYSIIFEKKYAYLVFSTNTFLPNTFIYNLKKNLSIMSKIGFDEDVFNRYYRVNKAMSIFEFDSFKNISNMFIDSLINDYELFSFFDSIGDLKISDCFKALSLIDIENISYIIVK